MGQFNGFLTAGDREFLKELADQPSDDSSEDSAAKQQRYRIRERTKAAFRDFNLLLEHLPAEERDKIFERHTRGDREDGILTAKKKSLFNGMVATLAFVYEGYWANNWQFEKSLWGAIEKAHSGNYRLPRQLLDGDASTFEVALTPAEEETLDLALVEEKAHEGELLTDREYRIAIEHQLWPGSLDDFRREQRKKRRMTRR